MTILCEISLNNHVKLCKNTLITCIIGVLQTFTEKILNMSFL